MSREHRLRIAGEIAQVPNACNWVVQVAEEVGLEMRDVNHLELAVDEAVTNIIEHAYGDNNTDKGIDIIIHEDGNKFKITIVDEVEFNPLQLENPDPMAQLEDRGVGGWGVFFIKKLMDDVGYEFSANKNHLIMTKNIS